MVLSHSPLDAASNMEGKKSEAVFKSSALFLCTFSIVLQLYI